MSEDWMKGRIAFGTPGHFALIEDHLAAKNAEIERLNHECAASMETIALERAENERLWAALQEICDTWLHSHKSASRAAASMFEIARYALSRMTTGPITRDI